MSNSSFTPGPWAVDSKFSGYEYASTGRKEHAQVIGQNGDSWTPIARCQSNAKATDNLANARLIAAAPELLEALESAQMAIMGYTHQNAITLTALEKARAAIAKARGTA